MGERVEQLRVDIVHRPDAVTVVLVGELDLTTTGDLDAAVTPLVVERPARVEFDCERLAFIDCAGLAALVGAVRVLAPQEPPVLRRPSPMLVRVLALTGTAADFELADVRRR